MPFGFTLVHDGAARTVTITVTQSLPAAVGYRYPLRLGRAASLTVDGQPRPLPPDGADMVLPGGMQQAVISQVHARHILLSTNELEDDQTVQQKLATFASAS